MEAMLHLLVPVLIVLVAALGGTALVLYSKNNRLQGDLYSMNKLLEASAQLNSMIHDPDELLSEVMLTAAEVIGAEAASVILRDETTGELYFKVATGEKGEEVREMRLQMGEGIAGWVARQGKPLRVDSVQGDARWSSRVSVQTSFLTRNLICVPIRTKRGIIGVLQAINKVGAPHFQDRDVKLLEAISVPTGVAVENARLYKLMEKSIS